MFGLAGLLGSCVAIIEQERINKDAFDTLVASMPAELARELVAARKQRLREEQAHARALEVAREGRSLNFWGDR